MRLLLDTHILLWALVNDPRLTAKARTLIEDERNLLLFSPVSIAEVAIKQALGRADFRVDPQVVQRQLIADGYVELPLTAAQAVAIGGLPTIHEDPFDRLLIAQATVEGVRLVSGNRNVVRYGGVALAV